LQQWLQATGAPTPAREELKDMSGAAEDARRLRKQMETLREAELELAAREAEETARNFAMLVSCQYANDCRLRVAREGQRGVRKLCH
jgi:hypothetical protein